MSSRYTLPMFHTWPSEALYHAELPGGCLWADKVWELPRETPGLANAVYRIDWNASLGDGTNLTDLGNGQLLDSCRRIVWCWLASPPAAALPKFNAVGWLYPKLVFFLRWMVENGFRDFSCVRDREMSKYRRHLSKWIDETADQDLEDNANGHNDRLLRRPRAAGTLVSYIQIVVVIHHAREALASAGLGAPDNADPLRGVSPYKIAERLAIKAAQTVRELPDDIFAKVTNHAYRVIISPETRRLADVLNLVAERKDPLIAPAYEELLEEAGARELLEELDADLETGTVRAFRRQINRITAAAAIIIHALIALRPSELAGLNYYRQHDDPADHDPVELGCVTKELSHDGLFEIFRLKGSVYKHRAIPEEVDWVLGLRPVGATYFPPPVEAIAAIAKLFHSWRIIKRQQPLFAQIGSNWDVKGAYSDALRHSQSRLVKEALGDSTYPERAVTPQGWRKSFARYMFRMNPELLPAIANHFQHMSMATTERAYINPNPGTIDRWNNVAFDQAGTFISEVIYGHEKIRGPVANAVERLTKSVEASLSNLSESESRLRCAGAARRNSTTVYESYFGYCVFRADGANCLLADEVGVAPAFPRRTPDVCRSCKNFGVSDKHRVFWELRKSELLAAKQSTERGDHLRFVINCRLEACELVLCWLDGDDK